MHNDLVDRNEGGDHRDDRRPFAPTKVEHGTRLPGRGATVSSHQICRPKDRHVQARVAAGTGGRGAYGPISAPV
jgi:hypothetical protein